MALFVLAWVGFAISIISLWAKEGFIWALLVGIFGGGIFYYVSMIAIGILIWVANIALTVVRYLFYNAYTFLIAPLIVAGLVLINAYPTLISDRYSHLVNSTYTEPQTTQYQSTARSTLNIRSRPDINSKVVGTLQPNQTVEVYDSINGFAKIKHGTGVAYVSLEYLKRSGKR